MRTSVIVYVFLEELLQVIYAQIPVGFPNQDIPRECWGPPRGTNIFECCPLPVMHTDRELAECNLDKINPSQFSLEDNKDQCSQKLCLLRNKGILNYDDSIDYEKMLAFVENWAQDKPHIEEGLQIAKQICFTKNTEPQDAKGFPICEPDRLFQCITGNIIWNCKLKIDVPSCKVLKVHMDECRTYLYKDPSQ